MTSFSYGSAADPDRVPWPARRRRLWLGVSAVALMTWLSLGEPTKAERGEAGAAPEPAPAPADPEANVADVLVKTLLRELEERDAVIADLVRRVGSLEQTVAARPSTVDPVPAVQHAAVTPAAPPAPAPPAADRGQADVQVAATPLDPPGQNADESGAEESAAPGQFAVDPDAVDRALERTLVRTGALLLPAGKVEVEPSFRYTRREVDLPVVVSDGESVFVGEQRRRRNEFDNSTTVRVGIPLDAQAEFSFSHRTVNESTVTNAGGTRRARKDTGSGFGDIGVGLAKTVLREQGWRPDVIARVRWDTNTGETTDNGVPLGGGFHDLSGSVTMTKRQDPLVFVGQVSYGTTFENDGIDPGDQIGFSLGTVLAASPETSLRVALDQQFINETQVDGRDLDGSDRVMSTLSIGASSILGRGLFIDGVIGIGLTDDSPDYSVGVSVPIRFDLPVF